jgi:UDP-GlcNAc:undecaprenyl-phosphate GlcNAc-1-phosphate transferase
LSDFLHAPIIDSRIGDLSQAIASPPGDAMVFLLPLITAMAISLVIIPLMVRVAPKLGMMDKPDPRKVHTVPIPRVGGIGIVIGALLPLFLLLPFDESLIAYLFGAVVLLVFGAVDDCFELGHYTKFTGQFIAVLAVVYYGDVYVTNLP